MVTFAVVSSIVAFWLTLSLPNQVYPYYLKDFFNFRRNWQRLRDYFILLFGGPTIAFLITTALFKDIYNVIPFQEGDTDPKPFSLAASLWLLFIIFYYYLVMRHNRVESKNIVGNSRNRHLIDEISETDGKINRKLFIALIIFIITSIGEGFFQDLLYNPFLKPLLCKAIGILCG